MTAQTDIDHKALQSSFLEYVKIHLRDLEQAPVVKIRDFFPNASEAGQHIEIIYLSPEVIEKNPGITSSRSLDKRALIFKHAPYPVPKIIGVDFGNSFRDIVSHLLESAGLNENNENEEGGIELSGCTGGSVGVLGLSVTFTCEADLIRRILDPENPDLPALCSFTLDEDMRCYFKTANQLAVLGHSDFQPNDVDQLMEVSEEVCTAFSSRNEFEPQPN